MRGLGLAAAAGVKRLPFRSDAMGMTFFLPTVRSTSAPPATPDTLLRWPFIDKKRGHFRIGLSYRDFLLAWLSLEILVREIFKYFKYLLTGPYSTTIIPYRTHG